MKQKRIVLILFSIPEGECSPLVVADVSTRMLFLFFFNKSLADTKPVDFRQSATTTFNSRNLATLRDRFLGGSGRIGLTVGPAMWKETFRFCCCRCWTGVDWGDPDHVESRFSEIESCSGFCSGWRSSNSSFERPPLGTGVVVSAGWT